MQPTEWIIPAPLRTLLWWPPIALILAVLRPTTAAMIIAVVGAVLAVLGVLGPTVKAALPGPWASGRDRDRGGRTDPDPNQPGDERVSALPKDAPTA